MRTKYDRESALAWLEKNTPANQTQTFLDELASGLSISAAAGVAAIGIRTVYDWKEKDPEFAELFAVARAKGEARLCKILANGDDKEIRRGPQIMFLLKTSHGYNDHNGEKAEGSITVEIPAHLIGDGK